jgi:preprotein translocase subunit SecD
MRALRRQLAAAAALALLTTVTACGDDDGFEVAARVLLVYDEPAGGVDEAALRQAITGRLVSIGITVVDVRLDEPGQVSVGLDDERLVELAGDLLRQQGVLRFRPVLAALPGEPEGVEVTPAHQDRSDQEVVLTHRDLDGAIDRTYELGPASTGANLLESAAVDENDAGQQQIQLVLAPTALDAFNQLATSCFAKAPSCPTGLLAITVDGAVLAAPVVSQPTFERDQIVITPQYDEVATRRLATVLDTGPLPVALTPATPVEG